MPICKSTDANTSAPLFVLNQLKVSTTQDNMNIAYGNTTTSAFTTNQKTGVFAVSPNETQGTGNVASLTIVSAGTGFTARPTLTITGANTTQATATANGTLVAAAIDTAGSGYAVGDEFTTNGSPTAGVVTVTTVNGSGAVTGVSITTAGDFSTLPTLSNYGFASNTSTGGTGFLADLSIGVGATSVTGAGEDYNQSTVGVTVGGTGGTGASVTATLNGQDGTNRGGHAGWVLRTEGTGGRAGRVHIETLVAMGSITGDGADDTQFGE